MAWNRSSLLVTLMLIGSTTGLAGQQAGPVTMSLRDATRIARENNPAFQQRRNDRGAADWGVRNAYATFLPQVTASSSIGYTGAGRQQFLTTTFEQGSSTVSSSYSLGVGWTFSGSTLTRPGLRRAERDAVEADIASVEQTLLSTVTQNYLNVLQARANYALQRVQVERNSENLRLAQARFDVGQATLIDVRQAQVAKGQSDVELLRLGQFARVEALRLFEELGVLPPADVSIVQLTDTFTVIVPPWSLDDLLAIAAQENPTLAALGEREAAAGWQVKAARSQYLPSLSVSAGWSGFTQQFTNADPFINGQIQQARAQAGANLDACNFQNDILTRLADPLSTLDCSSFTFTPEAESALRAQLRDQNSVFPFNFTAQPFSASLTVSIPIFNNFERELGVSQAQAQREDAALARQQQTLRVRTEVSQRYYDVDVAHQTIAIQDTNVIAAREQLALAQERYKLGSGTFFELLEAQLTAQQAERDHLNSIYGYHRAVALLEAAVGRPIQ